MDAIDKDGMVFSATPSGAWMPSVIAGDTGIPLTERAQSFLLVPGQSQRAGRRQAAARDAEPDPRRPARRPAVSGAFHARRRQPGPGADADFLRYRRIQFERENAVEAPRFQTRHLVSSFDNHAWNPGDLLLDERISPATIAQLAERGHHTSTESRWSNGAAPVAIACCPAELSKRARTRITTAPRMRGKRPG